MSKCKLKFMFDWGSGVCFWSENDKAYEVFKGYPVNTDDLPISSDLKERIDALIIRHDEALNWDNPSDDLLWDDNQVKKFLKEAKDLYLELCAELGDEYEIEMISEM